MQQIHRHVRASAATVTLVLTACLALGSCTSGGDSADGDGASPSATPSATDVTSPSATPSGSPSALPEPTSTPGQDDTASDGDSDAPPFYANTDRDTGEGTGADVGTLTDIRLGGHDGFDRAVFELNGPDVPSWDVRYVEEAVADGSGLPVAVAGDAILEVRLFPVTYPFDGTDPYTGPQVVAVAATERVTQVVFNGMYEGYLQAFIGVDGGEQPFRAYEMTDPARVVIEVRHD